MNSKRGTIGQILTSFPSLVFVFVIMLIFVIISGAISKEHSESYSMLDDFLDDSIEEIFFIARSKISIGSF